MNPPRQQNPSRRLRLGLLAIQIRKLVQIERHQAELRQGLIGVEAILLSQTKCQPYLLLEIGQTKFQMDAEYMTGAVFSRNMETLSKYLMAVEH